MEIRRAVMEDLPAIFTCNVNAFKNYILEIGKAPAPMLMDFSQELDHDLFVAYEGDELLGFVLILPDEDAAAQWMWMDVLAVDPKHQGKGVGRKLIDYTARFIRQQGKRECRLYTNVKFVRTSQIYQTYGFQIYEVTIVNGYHREYMKLDVTKA